MGRVPPELLPPVITKVDPDSDPVMTVVVSSDAMSLRTLTEIADKQVKRAIETVNGVGQVDLGGGRAREVHIVVDIEKLNSYGLSIQQVRDAVVSENVEIPGGTVEQGKSELLLRTLGTHRRHRAVQQHRHRDQQRHADSRVRHRLRRGRLRAAAERGLAERHAGGAASTSCRRRARTRSRSSRASSRSCRRSARRCPVPST